MLNLQREFTTITRLEGINTIKARNAGCNIEARVEVMQLNVMNNHRRVIFE